MALSLRLYRSILLALTIAVAAAAFYDYHWSSLAFPNSDFETGTLDNWTATGDAFAGQPKMATDIESRVSGQIFGRGNYVVGTFEGGQGDTPVGTLESIPFTLRGKRLLFRLGGGNGTANTSVALVVGGAVVHEAISYGSSTEVEATQLVAFDIAPWRGKQAIIRIIDQAATGWGHINVDDFRLR